MTILIVICPIIVILCASNMVYCIYLNLSTHKYHSSIIIIIAFSDNNITMLRFIDATIFILGVSIREVLGSSSRAHPTKMSLVSEREREGEYHVWNFVSSSISCTCILVGSVSL